MLKLTKNRYIKYLFFTWLILTLVTGAYFYPFIDRWIRFNPSVASANFKPPINKTEARVQDLQYLQTILQYDRSFSEESATLFKEKLAFAMQRAADMSDAQFLMETHALMALADNAHTGSDIVSTFRQFNRAGVEFYYFKDGVFITRAHKNNRKLLGKKLIAIDGQNVDSILSTLSNYRGGPEMQRKLTALYFLRSPDLLHAVGLANHSSKLTLTLENTEGHVEHHTITALPSVAETEFFYRHPYHTLVDKALVDESNEWLRVLDGKLVTAPMTLKNDGDLVFSQPILDGLYIRSNYLVESPGHEVKTQLTETLSEAPKGGYPFVIVDLRWNPGGDLSNALPFAKRLGEAVAQNGKVYVLVGPHTFSAAIVTAALIKQYTSDRALLVGQPMGDRAQFWAERGESFVLPNSNYYMAYATGYHDWENGCTREQIKHCFDVVEQEAAAVGPLSTNIFIQPTFTEYAAGSDPVLDWVIAQRSIVNNQP